MNLQYITTLASQIPFGAGKIIADKAKVSQAFVSMLFNLSLKNYESEKATRVIEESIKFVRENNKKKSQTEESLRSAIKNN